MTKTITHCPVCDSTELKDLAEVCHTGKFTYISHYTCCQACSIEFAGPEQSIVNKNNVLQAKKELELQTIYQSMNAMNNLIKNK